MPEGRKAHSTRILVAAASTIVIIAGLKLAQGFFVTILLAVFIATVSFPITKRSVPSKLRTNARELRIKSKQNDVVGGL